MCRRSTIPETACSGFSNASRSTVLVACQSHNTMMMRAFSRTTAERLRISDSVQGETAGETAWRPVDFGVNPRGSGGFPSIPRLYYETPLNSEESGFRRTCPPIATARGASARGPITITSTHASKLRSSDLSTPLDHAGERRGLVSALAWRLSAGSVAASIWRSVCRQATRGHWSRRPARTRARVLANPHIAR